MTPRGLDPQPLRETANQNYGDWVGSLAHFPSWWTLNFLALDHFSGKYKVRTFLGPSAQRDRLQLFGPPSYFPNQQKVLSLFAGGNRTHPNLLLGPNPPFFRLLCGPGRSRKAFFLSGASHRKASSLTEEPRRDLLEATGSDFEATPIGVVLKAFQFHSFLGSESVQPLEFWGSLFKDRPKWLLHRPAIG